MAEPRQYPYQGQMVAGEDLEFESKGEQWNVYHLADGSKIKIKLVMMEVARLTGQYDVLGNPVYAFSAQQVVAVEANPELIRKAN